LLFLILAQDIAHADGAYLARRSQCPGRYLSLAGFEVTIIGRFWVTTEDVMPDGRFLVLGPAPATDNSVARPVQQIYVVLTWFTELQQRVPVK
jgi:hypothetical protein